MSLSAESIHHGPAMGARYRQKLSHVKNYRGSLLSHRWLLPPTKNSHRLLSNVQVDLHQQKHLQTAAVHDLTLTWLKDIRESYRQRESITRRGTSRKPSVVRLPPFNAEREAVEFFYRRERSCPSLPKRILDRIFGSEFVDRLISRAPAMKKRNCTLNQFEDLAKLIRAYYRQIQTAEIFYADILAVLPAKAFTEKPLQKLRLSIFGTGARQPITKANDAKKIRLAYFPGGFGHLTRGGKRVQPTTQLPFEDRSLLRQVLLTVREDFNPNAPQNVIKFNQKEGIVSDDKNISQSEIVLVQKGSKLRCNVSKGAQIVKERDLRYPLGPDGARIMTAPRRRYNYIESTFRPQQIWPVLCYEIATQTDPMPITNFTGKVRAYSVQDLYAAEQKRKKADNAEIHKSPEITHHPSVHGSVIEMGVVDDEKKLELVKAEFTSQWKLSIVDIHKPIVETKRRVADGAEWPVNVSGTKLISTDKQKSIQHIYRGLKLMEKLILQPFHHPVANDYRYFEDLLDVGRKTGSLLPLWNLAHPRLKNIKVEYAQWHPRYPDMFVCSGGRDEVWDSNIGPGQTTGFICWFSLRNPTYPEYLQYISKPVLAFDILPRGYILAGGTNDGNVLYINLGIRNDSPVSQTTSMEDYHTRAICQIKFLPDNQDGDSRFFSVGLEGNFREWCIEKHTVVPMRLIMSSLLPGFFSTPNWHLDQPHCVAFSSYARNSFLVGTMFGYVHLCDLDVFRHVKKSWRAHELPVSAVRWNPFNKDIFMTSGYDNNIFVYDVETLKTGHILKWTFDLGVRDVAWSPYNSTLFAALLVDGQFLIFDIAYSKYSPICSQIVSSSSQSRPEKIRFNNWGPFVLISDQSGFVQIFRLSPNLRVLEVPEQAIGVGAAKPKPPTGIKKKAASKSAGQRYPGIDLKTQTSKLDRLLATTRDLTPPTLKLGTPMKKYVTISGEPLSSKLSDGSDLKLSAGIVKDKSKDKGKD